MPFSNTFTEQERDKHFASKIMATEMTGILAWAVHGCLLWQQEGIVEPDVVAAANRDYNEEMDSFSHFFDECCVVRDNSRVTNKMLRSKYKEWCVDNGEYELSQKLFSAKLQERNFSKRRNSVSGGYEWYGFALRGEATRL